MNTLSICGSVANGVQVQKRYPMVAQAAMAKRDFP
jgi:hypothetical protein